MQELDLVRNSFQTSREVLESFCASSQNLEQVAAFAEQMATRIRQGNKIISCGNGGSMCDAMHFAEELTGRFREDRPSLPALSISDPSHLTCTGNDYGFDAIFSRYIEGVGQKGDLLLVLSTSGNSPNIIKAVEAARAKGMYTVGLLGKGGGKIKDLVDLAITVPLAVTSDRIQEIHIKVIHIAIETTEKLLGY
ncbi:MAG: phosphoheptose isomerase [SAR324 cluster bacterium]|uniref:Phosphoheptose isomerase n=1 Tax=SAR324 cluster bacterium TaxID=2024889 RepID=A0A2A4SW02_9DELT|nr:MAG: phosphoheptose isomerase [SAR324 cluster bacterium]